MLADQRRIKREQRTVEAMIALYCQAHHTEHRHDGHLCPECQALQDYARSRLEKCPFGSGKTTCARCPIHCYKPDKRAEIRAVMRCAGPRMLLRHPVLALLHLADGLRQKPARPVAARVPRTPTEDRRKVP